MSSATHGSTPHYFVPSPSSHPVMASIGLFFVILGASQWINGHDWGQWSLALGMVWWLVTLYRWFSQSIGESESGMYGRKIDMSFRWSMSWFIFSEVMFFGAFFTALWWARAHSLPALGSLENALLWPDFKAVWPTIVAGATRVTRRHHRTLHGHEAADDWRRHLGQHHGLPADGQHGAAAELRRHHHHRPPRADRGQACPHHRLHVGHGGTRRGLPVRAGLRVLPCLHTR